jgi:hypothetical protein
LDENFADAAQEIYHSNGRLVVTGIGKALSLHKNGGHILYRNTITVSSRI